jgi:hypothetical protein
MRNTLLTLSVFLCTFGGVACLIYGSRPQAMPFQFGLAAIVIGGVVAALAVVREYRRAPHLFVGSKKPFSDKPVALPLPLSGVGWVSIEPAYAKSVRRVAYSLYAVPVIVLVMWLVQQRGFAAASAAGNLSSMYRLVAIVYGVCFCATAVGAIAMHWSVNRHLRSRLGADATHLLYDPGNGRLVKHAWSSVQTDHAALLIGRRMVSLVRPHAPGRMGPYSQEALRGLILARIPPDSYVSSRRLKWNAVKRGNAQLWLLLGTFALYPIAHLVSWWKPEWHRAFRDALLAWLLGQAA